MAVREGLKGTLRYRKGYPGNQSVRTIIGGNGGTFPMPGTDDMNFLSPKPRRPSTCVYIVLQSRGAWWVDREGKALGPYETKEEAESGAFHLIDAFGDPERPIEVWSPDDSGKMRLVWKGDIKA